MERNVFPHSYLHQASHHFWNYRTLEQQVWLELRMGLHMSPQGGRLQNERPDSGCLAGTAAHSKYLPSRKVVLGLILTVLTTLSVYFNSNNWVTCQVEGNIFLSAK